MTMMTMMVVMMMALLVLLLNSAAAAAASSINVIRADRKVDLMTQVVRISTAWKVENTGPEPASELKLTLTAPQAERLAFMEVVMKGKGKNDAFGLSIVDVSQEGSLSFYTLALPKPLNPKETASFESYVALTHQLKPFPAEVTQSDPHLVKYHDSAYILSPYPIKMQTSFFKLPSSRVESFTKVGGTKLMNTEARYGPYENVEALQSEGAVELHFESNQPFAVVEELVREIEISHWGNVYVTENYKLVNQGARLKGSFSRFEYQARPTAGASSFRHLLAKLPVNAHSVYYRDENGNISTSHLRSDLRRTELELEPRFPLFGGWKAAFTLGYSVPLQDLVFRAPDGSRYLNVSFGSPFNNVVVDKLTLKVVLPEGSYDMSVFVPFPVEQGQETKYSYLDTVGRTVAVMVKRNSVLEHQFKFVQVHYRFNSLGMLVEPLMLLLVSLAMFTACIAYTHFDFTLSKSSAS